MMKNKITSIEWLINEMIENYHLTDDSYADFNIARQMYNDEIEAAAIIAAAEKGTQNASETSQAFAIGYSQGYTRALQLVQWQIENQLKTETK